MMAFLKGCLIRVTRNRKLIVSWGSALLIFSAPVIAKELPPGTVISAANIDQVWSDTFEGHTIESLLTERRKILIREYHLKMKLKRSEPIQMPDHWVAATKKFSGQVQYDDKARDVKGYVAGLPFPVINLEDPYAGIKIAWNSFLATALSVNATVISAGFNQLSMDKGFERGPLGVNNQVRFTGRTSEPHALGDGSVVKKSVILTTAPYDNAGLGAFTINYRDGRPDDVWAYIKSVRRIRRISGNNWMDSLAGTDLVGDDNYALDAHPNWYKSFKVIGKRWILASAHGSDFNARAALPLEKRLNLQEKPYGMPIDIAYEPREVFIVEGIPPDEHPYSKKILYADVEIPSVFWEMDAYDRKGAYWKWASIIDAQCQHTDGQPGLCPTDYPIYDFQKNHATFITVLSKGYKGNVKEDPEKYAPSIIEKMIATGGVQ